MRSIVVALLALTVSSCPADDTPPDDADARAFINALLAASAACDSGFLDEAEPIFVQAQVDAQVEIAIANFERNLANEHVQFVRVAYDQCFAAANDNDCGALQQDQG